MGLKSPALCPLLGSPLALTCQQGERGLCQWIIHSHSNFPAETPYGTEVSLSCICYLHGKFGGKINHKCWYKTLNFRLVSYAVIDEWSMDPKNLGLSLISPCPSICISSFIKISFTFWGLWTFLPRFEDLYLGLSRWQLHHPIGTWGHFLRPCHTAECQLLQWLITWLFSL